MDRRRFLSTCATMMSVGAVGCSAPSRETPPRVSTGEWPKFRYDNANTGYSEDGSGPGRSPSLKWDYQTGDAIWGSPVISDGVVCIGSYDNYLYALSAETGEEFWNYRSGDRIDGTPAVSDGTLYFGSFDKKIHAVDLETGKKQWEYETGGFVRSSPAVDDGTVFVGSHCRSAECAIYYDEINPPVGFVYALDAESGDLLWQYETGDGVLSSPAVTTDTVYIGSSDRNIHAIDRSTGEATWTYETANGIFSSPVLSEDTVYTMSNRDKLYALDAETGDLGWTFEPDASILTCSPAVFDDVIYFGGGGLSDDSTDQLYSKFYAISTDQGRELWSRRVSGAMLGGSPAIVNGVIYVGSNRSSATDQTNPGIFALTDSGDEYWSHTVDETGYFNEESEFGSSPAVVDDTLYIGSADGHVYAFH